MDIENKNTTNYEFDIALSFAGEDRYFVKLVANELKSNGLTVFYDEYEEIDLWGKNLHDHLTKIYSKDALFCVMFISEYYAKKVWTNLERQSAQSRAIRQKKEYILPARFDDTELPGMDDISYINLNKFTPVKFAELIISKLKKEKQNNLSDRLKNYIEKSVKFNYTLEFYEIRILEVIDESRFPYRAISKIAQEVNKEKEYIRKKLKFLSSKRLVKAVQRPGGIKWMITLDGKDYLDYYYRELDESSC